VSSVIVYSLTMTEISTTELERRLGVSRHQLKRWTDAGLLLPPRIVKGPDGRGWRGMYPAATETVIRHIQDLSGRGVPLRKIAQRIQAGTTSDAQRLQSAAENADAALRAWSTVTATPTVGLVPELRDVVARGDFCLRDVYQAMVSLALESILDLPVKLASRIASQATEDRILGEALRISYFGWEPVLIYSAAVGVAVGPDFAIGLLHSRMLHQYATKRSPSNTPPLGLLTLMLAGPMKAAWLAWPKPTLPEPGPPCWLPALAVDEVEPNQQLLMRYPLSVSQADTQGRIPVTVHLEAGEPLPANKDVIAAAFAALSEAAVQPPVVTRKRGRPSGSKDADPRQPKRRRSRRGASHER
jgi:DNA-binding transcriptional MerR regulator